MKNIKQYYGVIVCRNWEDDLWDLIIMTYESNYPTVIFSSANEFDDDQFPGIEVGQLLEYKLPVKKGSSDVRRLGITPKLWESLKQNKEFHDNDCIEDLRQAALASVGLNDEIGMQESKLPPSRVHPVTYGPDNDDLEAGKVYYN